MAGSFGDNKYMRKKYICPKSQAGKMCGEQVEEHVRRAIKAYKDNKKERNIATLHLYFSHKHLLSHCVNLKSSFVIYTNKIFTFIYTTTSLEEIR
jgi:hypothetical protein